jgi:hypothetical protein
MLIGFPSRETPANSALHFHTIGPRFSDFVARLSRLSTFTLLVCLQLWRLEKLMTLLNHCVNVLRFIRLRAGPRPDTVRV